MDLSYTIQRATVPLGVPDAARGHAGWEQANRLKIAAFPWRDSGHRPETDVRLLWDDRWLAVRFDVRDRYVRAVAEHTQDPVCLDSCVEMFVSPGEDCPVYFNFEVNAGGVMLLYRGPTRDTRTPVSEADIAAIAVSHSLPPRIDPEIAEPCDWSIEYHVPLSIFSLDSLAPKPEAGTVWKGNFYKCGDRTSHPHWGSWAPVGTPRPDFHRPEYFATLYFST